jgi:hypothetical protein
MQRYVYWDGLLRRNDEETHCSLRATEVTQPGDGPPAHTGYEIIHVSKRLPNGEYDLVTHGERLKARQAKGLWVVA